MSLHSLIYHYNLLLLDDKDATSLDFVTVVKNL